MIPGVTESRETIGYVSRWMLLSMVAVLSAVAAALAAYSVMMMPSEVGTRVMMADFARLGSPPINMTCFQEPPTPVRRMLVISVDDGPVRGYMSAPNCPYIVLPGAAADTGDHYVNIVGCPYGAAAFEQDTPKLRIVSPNRPLYLIDARAALQAAEQGKMMDVAGREHNTRNDLIGTITKFSVVGTVLLFHPGTPREMSRDRARLRALGVTTPVVTERLDPSDTPLRSMWRLQGNLQPKSGTHILTADMDFYNELTKAGFKVTPMTVR